MALTYLAPSEVELINPRVRGSAYTLLHDYGVAEWHDQRGNWHVVVAARRIPEIERAERQERRRTAAGHLDGSTQGSFGAELDKAMARLKARPHP